MYSMFHLSTTLIKYWYKYGPFFEEQNADYCFRYVFYDCISSGEYGVMYENSYAYYSFFLINMASTQQYLPQDIDVNRNLNTKFTLS